VVCYWEGELLLVSQSGDTLTYPCDWPVHLCPEIDGVRVISASSHELLQKVPTVVQKILLINSVDPGSYLLEASHQFQVSHGNSPSRNFSSKFLSLFQARSHRADEYLRLVKDRLPAAVNSCIEAAGYEFQDKTQDMLIRVGTDLCLEHSVVAFDHGKVRKRCGSSIADLKGSFLSGGVVWEKLHSRSRPRKICPDVQNPESSQRCARQQSWSPHN